MKKLITLSRCGLLILMLLASSLYSSLYGQVQANGVVAIVVDGTSNVHDWDIKSNTNECTASYVVDGSGVLTSITHLQFSIKAETLKSGKGAMDKNTYKAIKTDKYPDIVFTGTSASIRHDGGNNYTILCNGKLTISSVTKNVAVTATCTLGADKSLKGSGSFKMKMSEYNVTPPSIMFGAIKTGDAVTVKYEFNLKSK